MSFLRNFILFALVYGAFITSPYQLLAHAKNNDTSALVGSNAALQIRLSNFKSLVYGEDIAKIFDYLPPKIFTEFLGTTQTTDPQMRAAANAQWKQTLKTISIEQASFGTNDIQINTSTIGRSYALIPLNVTMGVNADNTIVVKTSSTTIALVDAGMWYIVRLEKPVMIDLFKKSYPDLADITFQFAVTEVVKREVKP